MEDSSNYYAILTADVRYSKDLSANEKLLYAEITCLTRKEGYCWASNKYLSELFNCTPQAISKWIGNLMKFGFIECEYTYKNNSKEIDKRFIKLTNIRINNDLIGVNNGMIGINNDFRGINNCVEGYQQTIKGNSKNINISNLSNNKYNNKENNTKEFDILNFDYNFTSEKIALDFKKFTENEPDLKFESLVAELICNRLFTNKKDKVSENAYKGLLKKLKELSNNDFKKAELICEQAILGNWKTFYPLKENFGNENKSTQGAGADFKKKDINMPHWGDNFSLKNIPI